MTENTNYTHKMWEKVIVDGVYYLIKCDIKETLKRVLLTDLVYLWFEEIHEENLLSRCKELNPLVEASDDVLLGYIWSLMDGDATRSLSDTTEGCKSFNLQINLDGLRFKMRFLLTPANQSKFFEEVTQQLLSVISVLEQRQQLLMETIKSKDVEIQEYKLEGAQISRKAVETLPFDVEGFSARCAGDVSTSKTSVVTCPFNTVTPLVQELFEQISSASVMSVNEDLQIEDQSKRRKQLVLSKSPVKPKKLRMYDDNDDDYTEDKELIDKPKQKEEEAGIKQLKRKPQQKLKKALLNL